MSICYVYIIKQQHINNNLGYDYNEKNGDSVHNMKYEM